MSAQQRINYFQVLGIPSNSTKAQIKKAYYKLAKELHPDINPSPEAAERFKLINEAYENLEKGITFRRVKHRRSAGNATNGSTQKKQNQPPPTAENEEFTHRDKAYQERKRKQQAKPKEPKKIKVKYHPHAIKAAKFFRATNWALLAYILLVFIDMGLPKQTQEFTITEISDLRYRGDITSIVKTSYNYIPLHGALANLLHENEEITMVVSPIFKMPYSIFIPYNNQVFRVDPKFSLHDYLLFLPVLILITIATSIWRARTVEDYYASGIFNLVLMYVFSYFALF